MKQEIYKDRFDLDEWDTENCSRCFIHIVNSMVWRRITGSDHPHVPPTAAEYTEAGLPWFEYYDETARAIQGSDRLQSTKSVAALGEKKHDVPLPENEAVDPDNVVQLRAGLGKHQVREGVF